MSMYMPLCTRHAVEVREKTAAERQKVKNLSCYHSRDRRKEGCVWFGILGGGDVVWWGVWEYGVASLAAVVLVVVC